MFDPQLTASGGEESGAVGRAAIGEEALNGDAMSLIELDGLMESVEDAGDGFIREEAGEGQPDYDHQWRREDFRRRRRGCGWVRSPVARTPGFAKRPSFLNVEIGGARPG